MGRARSRLAIGDFSRMTHLSVTALRHNDDVGLLEPAEVDPASGYRYYALAQVGTAQVIRRLRALGMLTWCDLHTSIAPPAPTANWSHIEDGKIAAIRV